MSPAPASPRSRRRRLGVWLAGLLLAAAGLWHATVQPLSALQRLELAMDDLRQRSFLSTGIHPDIVIVDVDEASLRELGRWPWPRDRMAQLLDELFQRQRVAAAGFDFLFAEPDEGDWSSLQALAQSDAALAAHLPVWRQALDHDATLARALLGRPVVLGYYLSADRGGERDGVLPPGWIAWPAEAPPPRLPLWTGYGANLPVLAEAAPRGGFFNATPDEDGVVRTVPAVAWIGGELQASLALAMARAAAGDPPARAMWATAPGQPRRAELTALQFDVPGPATASGAARGTSSRQLALDEHGALRVPYRGPGGKLGGSFRYVSAADLIGGRVTAGELAGRLVLIGSSAPGLADLRATPVNAAMPGVEVHANLLAGLLDGQVPRRPGWAPGYEAALVLVVVVLAGLAATQLAGRWAMLAATGLAGLLLAGNFLAYRQGGLVLPIASALVLGAMLFFGAISASYVREWEGRRSLFRLFSSYLPPGRARELARSPSAQVLTADNRELTLLFCDLRGFSGIAETLPPLALRELLNQYLSSTTAVVHAHGGTLDKFIGDAVMAFWGAPQAQPDHAERAVRAALALVDGLGPLNASLRERGLPEVRFGVGLATGVVCVGDLGSNARRAYTAVGDAVNLAARLEALTREAGVDILVSESTRAAVLAQGGSGLAWLEVDQMPIRGRRQPVTVFTPVPAADAGHPAFVEAMRIWQLALVAARQHHVDQARAHLDRLNQLLALTPPNAPAATPATSSPATWLQPLAARLAKQLESPAFAPAAGDAA